jgi:predicted ABC-type ATPase
MTDSKQLWLLTGGNGSGKSTFYDIVLAPWGIKLVSSDLIARAMEPDHPETASYEAAQWAQKLIEALLDQGTSFCYETVFSHPSKIDLAARAKALGYEIILVYIHLNTPELNEARVRQRITAGGHPVPKEKIYSRIPRTVKNVASALPLADEARLMDNSSRDNPFRQIATVKNGRRTEVVHPLPAWAEELLEDIP